MAKQGSPRPQYGLHSAGSDVALDPTSATRKSEPAASDKAVKPSLADSAGGAEREPDGNSSDLLGAKLGTRSGEALPGTPVSPADFPVAQWDRYEFLGVLGQGGMG